MGRFGVDENPAAFSIILEKHNSECCFQPKYVALEKPRCQTSDASTLRSDRIL